MAALNNLIWCCTTCSETFCEYVSVNELLWAFLCVYLVDRQIVSFRNADFQSPYFCAFLPVDWCTLSVWSFITGWPPAAVRSPVGQIWTGQMLGCKNILWKSRTQAGIPVKFDTRGFGQKLLWVVRYSGSTIPLHQSCAILVDRYILKYATGIQLLDAGLRRFSTQGD